MKALFPPKRILAPVDLSEVSLGAWGLAKHLASRLGAELEALHVHESPALKDALLPHSPRTQEVRRRLEDRLRAELGEGARFFVREGNPASAILQSTQERNADMIVMGTRGRTGLPHVVFGSTAESLTRRSPVPVITLRGRWKELATVLVPLNFKPYSFRGFFPIAALVEALGARMDVFYVATGALSEELLRAAFQAVTQRLPPYFDGKPPELVESQGDPAEAIVSASDRYDLVALVSHRRGLIHDMAFGTTAERVLRRSEIPVLAMPDASREELSAPLGFPRRHAAPT